MQVGPGDVIEYDYRDPGRKPKQGALRLVQWNIERGYKLAGIIQKLQELDVDIIGLQELDIGCGRTQNVNVPQELARQLGMHVVFVPEFLEIESPLRRRGDEGGGLHGNAILSRFQLKNPRSIEHKYQPFDWDLGGEKIREPRHGKRYSVAAEAETPEGRVLVYSVHLEVFCGPVGRLIQFSEILSDSQKYVDTLPYQVICGDLNTMNTGVARLSTIFNTDPLRWRTLGISEARLWDKLLFSFTTDDGPSNTLIETFFHEHVLPHMNPIPFLLTATRNYNQDQDDHDMPPPISPLMPYFHEGLHIPKVSSPSRYMDELTQIFTALRNPMFYDPFPVDEPSLVGFYRLFRAKLDWLHVRRLIVQPGTSRVGVDGGQHSDHFYLVAEVTFDHDDTDCRALFAEKRRQRFQKAVSKRSKGLLQTSVGLSVVLVGLLAAYRNRQFILGAVWRAWDAFVAKQ